MTLRGRYPLAYSWHFSFLYDPLSAPSTRLYYPPLSFLMFLVSVPDLNNLCKKSRLTIKETLPRRKNKISLALFLCYNANQCHQIYNFKTGKKDSIEQNRSSGLKIKYRITKMEVDYIAPDTLGTRSSLAACFVRSPEVLSRHLS